MTSPNPDGVDGATGESDPAASADEDQQFFDELVEAANADQAADSEYQFRLYMQQRLNRH